MEQKEKLLKSLTRLSNVATIWLWIMLIAGAFSILGNFLEIGAKAEKWDALQNITTQNKE